MENYFLLIKTGNAEFRAWDKLAHEHKYSGVTPIVELTRGKKKIFSKEYLSNPENSAISALYESRQSNPAPYQKQLLLTPNVYNFNTVLENVKNLFAECDEVILDVTLESELACLETDSLLRAENGYENWCNFITDLHGSLPNLSPCILVNPSDNQSSEQYEDDLRKQFDTLASLSKKLYFRVPITIDDEFYSDLDVLEERILDFIGSGSEFSIILDHEQIKPGTGILHAARTLGYLETIKSKFEGIKFITLATSFPRVIAEVGDPFEGAFPIEEIILNEEIRKQGNDLPLLYGDYGSINPIRNDLVMRGGGMQELFTQPPIEVITSEKRMIIRKTMTSITKE